MNTNKQLNFLDWQKAFDLYISLRDKNLNIEEKEKIKAQILKLKAGMNNSRIFTGESTSHEIKITPYWLLGFIEAEATFFVTKNKFQQIFILGQTIAQKPVIEAIAQFLLELIPNEFNHLRKKETLIGISVLAPSPSTPGNEFIKLSFFTFAFISQVFSPFLEGLTFFSKKELDFKDWQIVTQLKFKDKHLTPEGREVINYICNRMNNYRLSTNLNSNNTLTIQKQEEMDPKIQTLLEETSFTNKD